MLYASPDPEEPQPLSGAAFPERAGWRSPFVDPAICMLETRLATPEPEQSHKVSGVVAGPEDAASLAHQLIADSDREHFLALYLNIRHVVTHVHIVSRGTASNAPVHPREVFKGAILANASALIVAHNHPSGELRPSQDDEVVARRLKEAGELLGIELLDSIIVGPTSHYYSLSEKRVRPLSR